jgi:two-component system, OmpR family, sensor histidine kinase CiaH
MSKVTQKRWVKLFVAVSVLMLTQVAWWLDVFSRNVKTIAELKQENATLRGIVNQPGVLESIKTTAYHKQLMFFSETFVFAALTGFGLYLLFRALRFQEKARETQKQFIETMTHESKTPLTALKLRLESIIEKNQGESQLSKELGQSLEEVRRLGSVFEKALHLNRMENYAFRFEEIPFSDTVKEVIRRMDPLFRQKSVKVTVTVAENVWVRGDLFGLQNTVQSLLENAVLYNDKVAKEVQIELREQSSEVSLKIADNGPGIPETEKEKIFEKFYRAKTSRRIPGTGLGLYLTKHIVESHSGKIELKSNVQDGACFEVRLPRLGGDRA